jgi:hypothetical protein
VTDPKANNVLVETLGSSLRHGGSALSDVPDLLKRVLAEEAWREFVTRRGEHVEYERFADFVTTEPLKGLGASVELIERIVADDDETVRRLREALKGTRNNITGKRGTRKDYGLERLSRDAPELHADVLAGRLSAHGAMVQAGFRPKTVSVPVTKPEAVARALLKYMSANDIAKLIAVLVGEAHD